MCELVETTSAEARSIRGEVESKVATLVAKADASIAHAVEEIMRCIREVAAYSDVPASRVTAEVMQQLESEIVAVATGGGHCRDCQCKHTHHSGRSALRHPGAIGTNPGGRSSQR